MNTLIFMMVINIALTGFLIWRILRIEILAAKFDEDLTLRAENVTLEEEGIYDGN